MQSTVEPKHYKQVGSQVSGLHEFPISWWFGLQCKTQSEPSSFLVPVHDVQTSLSEQVAQVELHFTQCVGLGSMK